MKRLDRRRFLQWTWLGPAALVLGSSAACRRSESEPGSTETAGAPSAERRPGTGGHRDPERLAAEVRRHFHYLEIDEASLARFARDYLRHFSPPNLAGTDLYSHYLISSDFFQNGADESKTVRYVAIYNPYLSACRNPFARLDG